MKIINVVKHGAILNKKGNDIFKYSLRFLEFNFYRIDTYAKE